MGSRRLRSTAVALGGLPLLASGLSACAQEEVDYAAVCMDQETSQRVDDDQCDDDSGGGFGWYFFPVGIYAPAIGARVTGGTFRPPAGATSVRGGVPAGGAQVTRGGFGGGFRSGGGFGG